MIEVLLIVVDTKQQKTLKQERAISPPPRLKSRDLFAEHRHIYIEHDGHDYILRLTNQGKLILTK